MTSWPPRHINRATSIPARGNLNGLYAAPPNPISGCVVAVQLELISVIAVQLESPPHTTLSHTTLPHTTMGYKDKLKAPELEQ